MVRPVVISSKAALITWMAVTWPGGSKRFSKRTILGPWRGSAHNLDRMVATTAWTWRSFSYNSRMLQQFDQHHPITNLHCARVAVFQSLPNAEADLQNQGNGCLLWLIVTSYSSFLPDLQKPDDQDWNVSGFWHSVGTLERWLASYKHKVFHK